jgi:hypothetical protein
VLDENKNMNKLIDIFSKYKVEKTTVFIAKVKSENKNFYQFSFLLLHAGNLPKLPNISARNMKEVENIVKILTQKIPNLDIATGGKYTFSNLNGSDVVTPLSNKELERLNRLDRNPG